MWTVGKPPKNILYYFLPLMLYIIMNGYLFDKNVGLYGKLSQSSDEK